MNDFVQRYGTAVNAHRWDEVREFYAPNIRLNDVESDPDAVIAGLVGLTTAFPDWRWEIRHLAHDGDLVMALLRCTGTHQGVFAGIEPTGRQVVVRELAHYRVTGDQIAEAWIGLDTAGVLDQLSREE